MKLTLDKLCLSTNDLCLKCAGKLKLGEVSKYDIEIGKAIIKASRKYKILKDITMEKIISTENTAYILVKKGDKEKFMIAGYVFLNELSDIVGTNIAIVEKSKKMKTFVETLVSPAAPTSTTTIFIPPNGEKELKIVFPESEKKKIKLSATDLSQLLNMLYGVNAHYAYN